jgi:hypothetical protein
MIKKEQIKILKDCLKIGMSISDSCNLADIGRTTYYQKIKEDPKFAKEMIQAKLENKKRNIALVQAQARKRWQASAWWLERKYPEEFGRRQRIEHSTHPDRPVEVNLKLNKLSDQELRTLEKIVRMGMIEVPGMEDADSSDE